LHADGQYSLYDKVSGDKSGGETQTPYYIAVHASMYRLYMSRSRDGRPTCGVVLLDEAFGKMDESRIVATLTFARNLGLQLVLAELAAEGCVRLVRHTRGHVANEPREIRLGPLEVGRAIEAARTHGYEPLSAALAEVERHAEALATEPQLAWMRTFLEALVESIRRADPSVLG